MLHKVTQEKNLNFLSTERELRGPIQQEVFSAPKEGEITEGLGESRAIVTPLLMQTLTIYCIMDLFKYEQLIPLYSWIAV